MRIHIIEYSLALKTAKCCAEIAHYRILEERIYSRETFLNPVKFGPQNLSIEIWGKSLLLIREQAE